MKSSFKTGVSFGLTSGVITTLGLLVGLHAGTHSRTAVLGGILTIAVADALSDALGIHITEEANRRGSTAHVWESTAATFTVKFISAASFALPVLMLPLEQAVIVMNSIPAIAHPAILCPSIISRSQCSITHPP